MITCTRRRFVAATGGVAILGSAAARLLGAEQDVAAAGVGEAIDFPSSYLYCAPTKSGIWVRVQMECRGSVVDVASGESNEYVMGVMAKTGLSPDARSGKLAPGYDYWIIFSNSHVFTKRSHSSAYLNNPTVLEHKDFGEASWHIHRAAAEPVHSAADIRNALVNWKRMSARTTFTSADKARQYILEYPVKWADYTKNADAFRVETGPVFLMNPDKSKVHVVPQFEDFQWAHFDFKSFDAVRCLMDHPTSILADATFSPPLEDGRENRQTPPLTDAQIQEIRDALSNAHLSLPKETIDSLLSTDHYSQVADMSAKNELFVLSD